MAKPLIQFLSETSGFCCQWRFLTQEKYLKLTNKKLARVLGVSERTVSETRSMMHDGGIACRNYSNCERKSDASKKR